jgi:Xaa-Pro aminopeptidase
VLRMDSSIIKNRLKTIRRELNSRNIDLLILTKPANVTYTTGFLGDDSWAAITKARVYLLTDSRYSEQAQGECPTCTIIERAGPIVEAVVKLVRKLKSIQTIAVEKTMSLADFEALRKSLKTRLKTVADIVESVRSTKDSSEVAAIKTAASIAAQALKQTLQHIKPGVTENELAGIIDLQMRKLGATNGFDTIIAFGPNASRLHHQPGKRKLRQTDTVLIDFGAKYKGYCSDITRCFVVGKPTAFYKKVYDVVQQAQAAAIGMIKAGAEVVKVDAAPRKTIRKHGLPVYRHGTGHGFGLEIHESPFLKADSKARLEAGQVLTIEPGVYIPGKLGVRIEDDVLVTQTGCRMLTGNCPQSYLLGR